MGLRRTVEVEHELETPQRRPLKAATPWSNLGGAPNVTRTAKCYRSGIARLIRVHVSPSSRKPRSIYKFFRRFHDGSRTVIKMCVRMRRRRGGSGGTFVLYACEARQP